jgi:hypothetical protein
MIDFVLQLGFMASILFFLFLILAFDSWDQKEETVMKDFLMVTIMQGVPGSGKSTIAKKLRQMDPNSEIVSADDFFVQADGSYVFDRTKLGDAHKQCQAKARMALEKKMSVIVDNTNIKKKDAQFYLDLAKEFNAEVQVIRVVSDFKNVHNVPQEVVDRMNAEMENILF